MNVETVRDEIIGLERRRCAALTSGDIEVLWELMADDLVHIHGNGAIDDKAGYLEGVEMDDEIEDPHALDMHMYINGEERQRGNTGSMIYNIFEQIAYLSTVMTLMPGDILATGTPSGVGAALDPRASCNRET
jgi:hypothetical protein